MAEKEKSCAFRTSIGGQALIEGILMRGPKKEAIVIRSGEELITKVEDIKATKDKYPILGWPFVRGVVNLIASLANGMRALTYSAQFMPEDEQEQPDKFDQWIEKKFGSEKAEKIIITTSVVLGIIIAVGMFILLPTLIAGLLDSVITAPVIRNLIEGVLRIAIFLLYIWLVSKMEDIRRVWMYHGAEHKTIYCYEAGLDLTVENCRNMSRLHPRCGTSFLFIVMIVSILVFSVVSVSNMILRLVLRIVLLPVVVAISYEIIKYAGRHDNWLTKILSAPGKAMQKFTTAEPDDSMLEVAIEAMKLVIPENEGDAKW